MRVGVKEMRQACKTADAVAGLCARLSASGLRLVASRLQRCTTARSCCEVLMRAGPGLTLAAFAVLVAAVLAGFATRVATFAALGFSAAEPCMSFANSADTPGVAAAAGVASAGFVATAGVAT